MRATRMTTVFLGCLALLAGCSSPGVSRLDDREQVVRAVLTLLASDNRSICVDGRSSGQALDIWREASLVPERIGGELGWMVPRPLRPTAIKPPVARDPRIPLPAELRSTPLPRPRAIAINNAARRMAIRDYDKTVRLARSWMPPRVTSRWWLINRLSADCAMPYTVSNPAFGGNIAFVSVEADHWSALYAVHKTEQGWNVISQWLPWMY